MGTGLCCSEQEKSEVYLDNLQLLESRSYRANLVHTDKLLESIAQVNEKKQEYNDMERINQLLEAAENRIHVVKPKAQKDIGSSCEDSINYSTSSGKKQTVIKRRR